MRTSSTRVARYWSRLAPLPGGRWLFARVVIALAVPYSGSIGATIVELEPGFCRARLRDRRRIRNHLRSIHAVALANLGELTSGLAMTMALPPDVRGIVTTLQAEYLRKARGELVATARVSLPAVGASPVAHVVESEIADAAGDVVCRVRTTWMLEQRSPVGP